VPELAAGRPVAGAMPRRPTMRAAGTRCRVLSNQYSSANQHVGARIGSVNMPLRFRASLHGGVTTFQFYNLILYAILVYICHVQKK
jgi:hypothetical protein